MAFVLQTTLKFDAHGPVVYCNKIEILNDSICMRWKHFPTRIECIWMTRWHTGFGEWAIGRSTCIVHTSSQRHCGRGRHSWQRQTHFADVVKRVCTMHDAFPLVLNAITVNWIECIASHFIRKCTITLIRANVLTECFVLCGVDCSITFRQLFLSFAGESLGLFSLSKFQHQKGWERCALLGRVRALIWIHFCVARYMKCPPSGSTFKLNWRKKYAKNWSGETNFDNSKCRRGSISEVRSFEINVVVWWIYLSIFTNGQRIDVDSACNISDLKSIVRSKYVHLLFLLIKQNYISIGLKSLAGIWPELKWKLYEPRDKFRAIFPVFSIIWRDCVQTITSHTTVSCLKRYK